MSLLRTGDVLQLLPTLVWDEIYRANNETGAPTDRDLKILSKKEQRNLRSSIRQVASELRQDRFEPLTNSELAKETVRRLRLAVRAVAGTKGTKDGKFLSKTEIARINNPQFRELVANTGDLKAQLSNWYIKDPELDGVEGASVNRTYAELNNRPLTEVIVAVLDDGVDIRHEDLQGKIWVNKGEVANNGIDDDGNGYVDDVNGWNFLGSVDADGNPVNIDKAALEVTREFKRMKATAELRILTPNEKEYLKKLEHDVMAGRAREQARFEEYGIAPSHYFDENYDERADIIGDDPHDLDDRFYGNNDVQGPDGSHGTHVAGTIAAVRGNGLGFDGVAEAVKIMSVRVIPNGDEYDKDVANAIHYAVDNGATVINMSFGKAYSPHKDAVGAAMRYAADNGVLVVHAAGNDAVDNDVTTHHPNHHTRESSGSGTWIEVGAMSARAGAQFPAWFSNYGNESVDLFAPGVSIDSTVPNNGYDAYNGTSMATPVVAGALALLKSAYPSVSATQLKRVLLESVRKYPDLKVWVPSEEGKHDPVDFSSLSMSGGVLDVLAAMRRLERESVA